ncbi:MAG: MFS transporter [Corynebacterium sp.]|nr:MFS transporter [Corynebacterium sp.]
MVVLDGTVVNLALARIQEELGLSDSARSWVITAYALAYGGLLLLGGRIGDVWGRKRAFLSGVAVFTVASLVCGLSNGDAVLLIARVAQGMGAAVASPTAMALIVVTFRAGVERNRAFSVFAMMTGVGSVLGLVIGGALTQASWRWIFLINVPIGALILIGGLFALRSGGLADGANMRLDVRGALLATAGSTLLVFGISATNLPIMGIGAVVLVAFFISQRKRPHAVLPLGLFTHASRACVFICLLLVGALLMAMTVQVAYFVQDALGYEPLTAGCAFIPFAFALGTGSALGSKLVEKYAPRMIVVPGALVLILGFVYGSTLNEDATYWANLFPAIMVIGIGLGMVLIPLTVSVVAGVQSDKVGPLTATSLVSQTLGGPIGLAAVTAYTTNRMASLDGSHAYKVGEAYPDSLLICAGLAAVVLVIAAIGVRFTPEDVAEGRKAEKASQEA